MRSTLWLALIFSLPLPAFAQPDLTLDHMAGTAPLVMEEPLDVVMVRGINYFAERELADSPNHRAAKWNRDYSSSEAYQKSVEPNRQRLREIIGAVDERVKSLQIDYTQTTSIAGAEGEVGGEKRIFSATSCIWDVLDGVYGYGMRGEGYDPDVGGADIRTPLVIVIPDADQSPEALFGGACEECRLTSKSHAAWRRAAAESSCRP
ncbi:MAG: hypothetical protein U0992_15865 [Planctomycetaceae bacterium]